MGLVEQAERLADEIAEHSPDSDELGRLTDTTWKLLHESGVLRALQPARFGGGEVPLVEFVDAVMVLSAASPSAGWVAGVIGVHPWQLALFDERAQQEMWGDDPTRMHSSSYNTFLVPSSTWGHKPPAERLFPAILRATETTS